MSKSLLFGVALMSLTSFAVAQSNSAGAKKLNKEEIFTPLKPADNIAYVFSSKEQMDAAVPSKKANVIEQIKKNENDPERVNLLRMELWRIENATIVEPKSIQNNK